MHGCIVQMPGVYIGRRGEAGKSEDVKKNGNEAGIRFLILFYFPDTPSLQVVSPHIATFRQVRCALPPDILRHK
jgi:hypothetical protein